MNEKRPRAREKHITSGGNGVHKRGAGLGSGQVGAGGQRKTSGSLGKRATAGGGVSLLLIIALLIGSHILGIDSGTTNNNSDSVTGQMPFSSGSASSGNDYFADANAGINTSVASGCRDKYTKILGNQQDTVTIMIYMCGTDLESRSGMASSDLQEMTNAELNDNINLIVYTGGCHNWKTSGISNTTNQIYQVMTGGLKLLVADDGAKSMTSPDTLSGFIQYCRQNFPANRNELILWDHGGGSVSGYGYDENYSSDGAMSLAGIQEALRNGDVKFDFIGFDACLMATAETAFMLNDYADYFIASEETEPGIGWYYTNWLTQLSQDTSQTTLEIGKNIIDDFISECARKCAGQKTTLSIIDLAEFSHTVPSNLTEFSNSVSNKISNQEYQIISDARYATREFAQSSKIDQIDLAHFAENMNTPEGKILSQAIQNAVKYNRTSSNISNAYGVSIYFPYQRVSYVDKACDTYHQIGMNDDYSNCIRQFAKLETAGQIASGGANSPVSSLLSLGSSILSSDNADMIQSLLNEFLTSSDKKITGLNDSNTDFMNDTAISDSQISDYISMHHFDISNLIWEQNQENQYIMTLPESQWDMIHQIDLNMFYDDGNGYIDLGLDNLYEFDENGAFIADTDKTWISVNQQPVAYYHIDTVEYDDNYTITGYIPAMLNDSRVNLILVFDNQNPYGYIAGATTDYQNQETDTIAKNLTELKNGDKLEFLCDYYSYDGEYQDSYYLGEPITVTDTMTISNTDIGDGQIRILYRFTDIYHQQYWTPAILN